MTIQLRSFVEIGKVIADVVGVKQKNFMGTLWFDLVMNTPVCTGYAKNSWFVTPGIVKSKNPNGPPPKVEYMVGSSEVKFDCKRQYPSDPPYPDLGKYKRNHSQWFIVNLAPYMEDLNNFGSKKKGVGPRWIDDIIDKHVIRANSRQ